jgi:hypothetical protein
VLGYIRFFFALAMLTDKEALADWNPPQLPEAEGESSEAPRESEEPPDSESD